MPDVLNISTANTAAQKAKEARTMARKPDPVAAKMYPGMNPNGPPSRGVRVQGHPDKPFADPSAYRVATKQTQAALKMYPSLATPENYDAKIDGKNEDGTDRVLIRNRRDVL